MDKPFELNITSPPELSFEQNVAGRKLFSQEINFLKGVVHASDLPEPDRIEVCFCGRSNVGKSSLINSLTRRKNLARTSNTPGRTQEINYFCIGVSHYLVDLPGYGFAKMPKSTKERRQKLLSVYLRGRASLRRVFVLVDARIGPKQIDHEFLQLLNDNAVSFQMIYTKLDKVKQEQKSKLLDMAGKAISSYPVGLPEVIFTSSKTKSGISNLQTAIAELV